jgi:hypothetical protein
MGFEMIGRIKRVPLREVWKHEAHDFTRWLEDNVDVLSEAIDLELVNAAREKSAGSFSVDLVAEDDTGNPVIIENQLHKSDHDHLGKLITYLTAIGASTAVWIVADPRAEHVAAVSWLNESSSASFYLLKLEAIQIEDSTAAPLLTLIVGPSEVGREAGDTKKEFSERHVVRRKFWATLLDRAKTLTKLHSNISPSGYSWIGTGAGKSGLGFNYTVTKHESKVELYIDRGKDSKDENEAIFSALRANKEAIETAFGEPLEWDQLETKRACRISKRFSLGGWKDEESRWSEIQDAMVDAMIRLEKALKPHIARLPS